MSSPLSSEQFSALRSHARLLIERTRDQENQLEAFVASIDGDVRHAQAAVTRAADADADQVRKLLADQVERGVAGAATARRLSVSARHQHVAARCLLTYLGADQSDVEPPPKIVLVVDDYRDVRELLSRVLQDAGFVVRTAANGLEGLIAAYEMRPGVIVMDVSMPVLDGIEATRLIKATEATSHARVIAHTGNSTFDSSLTPALFAAVLQKPAPPDVVLATVQHVAGL